MFEWIELNSNYKKKYFFFLQYKGIGGGENHFFHNSIILYWVFTKVQDAF